MTAEGQCSDCGLVGAGVTFESWTTPARSLCGDCRERAAASLDVAPAAPWLIGVPMDPLAVAAEPLPTLPGIPFVIAGSSAVIVGPTGGGRSFLVQACMYDASRHGLRCAYLGSEVTEPEFHARAADIASRRGDQVDHELREQLARVRYLPLAATLTHAWQNPDEWTREMRSRFDVIGMDPASAIAATLDLDFDKSNADYVAFHNRLVQPLVTANLAVLIPDNVGHSIEARSRAKGASAKSDVADLTFWCKLKSNPAGLIITAGKVRSVRAPFQRGDAWVFDRDTQRIERHADSGSDRDEPAFRPTVYMERVSRAVEAEPGLTRRALRDTVKGKHDMKSLALELLVAENYVEQRTDGQYPTHFCKRPYREETDGGPRGPHVVPNRSPGTTEGTGPPVPSLKDRGPGTAPATTTAVVPLADDLEARLDDLASRHPEAV